MYFYDDFMVENSLAVECNRRLTKTYSNDINNISIKKSLNKKIE